MRAFLLLLAFLATATARDYPAEIVRVVDGDTVVCNVTLGFGIELRNQHVRMSNANAPEKNTDEGKVSMGWLIMQAEGKACVIVTGKTERDKYGRILGRIIINGIDIGEKAKAEHFASGGPGRRGL